MYADTPFPGAAGPLTDYDCGNAVYDKMEVQMNKQNKPATSYKEVRIGNTIYRVTSVFTGEKDLGKTLEQLAIRRAMDELAAAPAY